MAQNPATGKPMDEDLLGQLLKRATTDAAFRDQLLKSPADALKHLRLRDEEKWVKFFHRLKADNFESQIRQKIKDDPGGLAEM